MYKEFIKFLNDNMDITIIAANQGKKVPALPFISVTKLNTDYSRFKEISREEIEVEGQNFIKENINKYTQLFIQFDSYAETEEEAEENLYLLLDNLVHSFNLLLLEELGLGVLEHTISSIKNLTKLEHSDMLYRYNFDVKLDYMREFIRNIETIETVNANDGELIIEK